MTTETASTSKPLLRSSLLQRQDTSNKFGILQDGVENVETLVKGKKQKQFKTTAYMHCWCYILQQSNKYYKQVLRC